MSGSGVSTAARTGPGGSVTPVLRSSPVGSEARPGSIRTTARGEARSLLPRLVPAIRGRRGAKGPSKMTSRTLPEDVQTTRPRTPISLSKAGVSRSAKAIRIRHGGADQLFQAEVSCSVDLNPLQKGVHMSRFEEE